MSTKRSKAQDIIIMGVKSGLIIVATIFLVVAIVDPNYTKYGGVLAAYLLPFLMDVVEKVLKTKVSFRLQIVYFVFLFVALFMGICMDLYRTVPFFDKVIHLVSGGLTVIVGYYVLLYFKLDKSKLGFRVLFMMCFSIAVGVLWEFFEFGCDKFLGQTMQELVSSGVDDTMYDLLSAIVGSAVGIYIYNKLYPKGEPIIKTLK